MIAKPSLKPTRPYFGSGPSVKHPGWNLQSLAGAAIQRSHRSVPSLGKIRELLDMTRGLLRVPNDYRIAITPASDTGAMEMAMWSLLGPRGVDAVVFDRFGELWAHDLRQELKLADLHIYEAPCGVLPDLSAINPSHDLVFCWNGTTSGVCVPDADWISTDRTGLTICDATSAAFAVDLPWDKLDVTTFSWQKLLGGEAAHGVIILSPRAIDRLENYTPPWPMPRIFRMIKDGRVNDEIFAGQTINTPSLLCIEDCLSALKWVQSIGGLNVMVNRCQTNYRIIADWVNKTPWIEFLVANAAHRSPASICLVPSGNGMDAGKSRELCQFIAAQLADAGVAFDIMGHREAPPNIRIWGGGMVESDDIAKLLPWIEWGYSLYINRS